jgi:hypothetical protein
VADQGFYGFEETLRHHAYLLLCQLFAMFEFNKLAYYEDAPDVVNDLLAVEEPELNKNIMMLAALARANTDARGGLAAHEKEHPNGVGTISVEGKEDAILTAREACNKIIHCIDVKLEFVTEKEHPLYAEAYKGAGIKDDKEYRVPYLHLNGKAQNGNPWTARLNMVQWTMAIAMFGG